MSRLNSLTACRHQGILANQTVGIGWGMSKTSPLRLRLILDDDGTRTSEERQAQLLRGRSLELLAARILAVDRNALERDYARGQTALLEYPERPGWMVNGQMAAYCIDLQGRSITAPSRLSDRMWSNWRSSPRACRWPAACRWRSESRFSWSKRLLRRPGSYVSSRATRSAPSWKIWLSCWSRKG